MEFMISFWSLDKLQGSGVPLEVLKKLDGIKNRKVSGDQEFRKLLISTLDPKEVETHWELLVKYAKYTQRSMVEVAPDLFILVERFSLEILDVADNREEKTGEEPSLLLSKFLTEHAPKNLKQIALEQEFKRIEEHHRTTFGKYLRQLHGSAV